MESDKYLSIVDNGGTDGTILYNAYIMLFDKDGEFNRITVEKITVEDIKLMTEAFLSKERWARLMIPYSVIDKKIAGDCIDMSQAVVIQFDVNSD